MFREAYVQILSQNAWTDPLLATAAMSSENRASSAVRNLRSLFENKASLDSSSPDSRGRSPSGIGGSDKENGSRPRSKVRASFVPVELAGMATATADTQGTAGLRRGSFSEIDGDGALSELKRTVSEQQGQRLVPEGAVESAAGSLTATPNKKPGEGRLGHDMPPENPDKAVTGQQESSDMKPADPSSEKAVSGGDALPPVAEDLRSTKKTETKKPTTNGKPAAISTKAPPKASSSAVKSPASQPKTPTSAKVSTSNAASTLSPSLKAPVKKPSRSSLTAPTAASLARAGAAGSDKAPSTKTSPTTKPKPREVTKPINLPSHLTAPTASSRAKHEPETIPAPAPAPSTSRTPATSRPKPTTTARTAPRASLPARPASRDSTATSRKSTGPVGSSFLDRMMKPTASSANRTTDRSEAEKPTEKPPKSKPAAAVAKVAAATKAKVNGAKAALKDSAPASMDPPAESTAPAETAEDEGGENPIQEQVSNESFEGTPAAGIQHSADTADTHSAGEALTFAEGVEEPPVSAEAEAEAEAEETTHEPKGNETPIPHTNGEEADASLEATPATIGDEETIR